MKIPLSTQPESMPQLLMRSLKLYQISFKHVFFLSFILAFFFFIPSLLTFVKGRDVFSSLPLFSMHKLWLILINFICLIFFAAVLWRVRCFMVDQHETLFDDLKIASKKLPLIVVAALIQSLLVMAVTFFFFAIVYYLMSHQQNIIVNASLTDQTLTALIFMLQLVLVLYIFFSLYFYLPIIVLENKGIIASLIKSAELVWTNWWATVCVQMTPWVVYCFALLAIKYLLHVDLHLYLLGTSSQESYWVTVLHLLLFAIFTPWLATVLLVQLHDLELRKNLRKP